MRFVRVIVQRNGMDVRAKESLWGSFALLRMTGLLEENESVGVGMGKGAPFGAPFLRF